MKLSQKHVLLKRLGVMLGRVVRLANPVFQKNTIRRMLVGKLHSGKTGW